MQHSLPTNGIPQKILETLRRYHVVLFCVFIVGGLATAVFLLNKTLVSASTPNATTSTQLNFDKATLDTIKKMHTSDQVDSETKAEYELKINQPRTNPLVAQ